MVEKADPQISDPRHPPTISSAQGPKTIVKAGQRGMLRKTGSQRPQTTPDAGLLKALFPSSSDLSEPKDPNGIQLGHFVIEERIGMGGMGAVFRALDTRLKRVVALKVLAPEQSHDISSVLRFQNEAQAAAQLDHDNIARVHYIAEDKGLHFIAFEFVTGTNVLKLIRQHGRLDAADAINYVLQIASALKHTMTVGVVHRDIKPSNIIITPNGRAKLVDLGLARKETPESVTDITVAGTTLGTFDYISPEQAKDPRNVTVMSDIYSLGCTLYHMLTGEPPYPDGTVLQKLLDHQGKEAPDPAQKNPHVSEELSIIVRKMMASDPRRRYTEPDPLIRDLMLVAGRMGMRGVNPEGLVWVSASATRPSFWQRHLGWMVTAVALLLIAGFLQRFGEQIQQLLNSQVASSPAESDPGPDSNAQDPPNKNDMSPGDKIADLGKKLIPDTVHPTTETPEAPHGKGEAKGDPSKTQEPDIQRDPGGASNATSDETTSPQPKLSGSPITTTNEDDTGNNEGVKPVPEPTEPVIVGPKIPDSPPEPPAIVVINPDTLEPTEYRSLKTACSEAIDGSIIELAFNGVRRVSPIRINKKHITLRAKPGFQPQIEFVPVKIPGEGYQQHMITIVNGSVEINNLHLRLTIPEEVDTDLVALFLLDRPKWVRLQHAVITVDNPFHRNAVIAELTSEMGQMNPGRDMMKIAGMREPLEIDITDSFLRGDCDLFLYRQSKPARFNLKDSVVALSGSLLRMEGNLNAPSETDRVDLRLEHVTCLLGGSLLDMDTGDQPSELLSVQLTARNNIFATLSDTPIPLISMAGQTELQQMRGLLKSWKGEKNFYDQYAVFWKFSGTEEVLDFDRWIETWGSNEVGANNEGIDWNVDARNELTFSEINLDDLALDAESPDNPAATGATNGSAVGAHLTKLPLIESTSEPEE